MQIITYVGDCEYGRVIDNSNWEDRKKQFRECPYVTIDAWFDNDVPQDELNKVKALFEVACGLSGPYTREQVNQAQEDLKEYADLLVRTDRYGILPYKEAIDLPCCIM